MNRHSRGAVSPLLATSILAVFGCALADDAATIKWSTGLEYSSGTYGGTGEIEDLYVPFIGRIDYDRFSLSLTVPYLSVRAPAGTTLTGTDGEPLPGSGETTTESGPGDVIASLTIYDVVYSSDLGLTLDLTGKVKFGTADEFKGLGTGENDYTVRTDVYKFFDRLTLLGSAGYKLRGDPSDIDLENVWLGTVGAMFLPNEKSTFGLVYDYRESALIDGEAVSELSAFLSRQVAGTWHVQFYTFTGFSDSSPDWGAGIRFSAG